MSKYTYILLSLLLTIVFTACGSDNSEYSSQETDVSAPIASAPLNKDAITFPNLPSVNTAVPNTYEIEQ